MIGSSKNTSDPAPSPCNNECKLGPGSICTGCYRTIAEITGWGQRDETDKLAILELCAQRKAKQA